MLEGHTNPEQDSSVANLVADNSAPLSEGIDAGEMSGDTGLDMEGEDSQRSTPSVSVASASPAVLRRSNALRTIDTRSEEEIAEEQFGTANLHANKKSQAGRGVGSAMNTAAALTAKGVMNYSGKALGYGGVAGAAGAGSTIGGSALEATLVGKSAEAAALSTAGTIFNPVGDAAKQSVWGQEGTGSYDYGKAAENVGVAGMASASVAGGLGALNIGVGAYNWYEGAQRKKAASEMVNGQVKDAAGVTLANEAVNDGKGSMLKGALSATGAGLKIAAGAGAANAGALMIGASVMGGVGGAVSVAEGGYNFYKDAKAWFNGKPFTPRTPKGKKWHEFAKWKKISRTALSTLKIVGGALAIAAAAVGTVAGAGIPLLIAAGVIGAGMGVSKIIRKYNNTQKIKQAKGKMKADGWYKPESDKPEDKFNKKGTLAERNKINDTKLAEKRSKPGKEDAESKYSVARGIIDALKAIGGLTGIPESFKKVKAKIQIEDGIKAEAKRQEKERKAAEPSKLKTFWNWMTRSGKSSSKVAPMDEDVTSAPPQEDKPTVFQDNSLIKATEKPIPEPSTADEEGYDAAHIVEKIGVSHGEALSGSGEELIEKRLSVTNSL